MSIVSDFVKNNSLSELLLSIQKNPDHYLYEKRLTAMHVLINGYHACYSWESYSPQNDKFITDTFPWFSDYVSERLSDSSEKHYLDKIKKIYISEDDAITNFVRLYEDYRCDYISSLSKGEVKLICHGKRELDINKNPIIYYNSNQKYYLNLNTIRRLSGAAMPRPLSSKKLKTFFCGYYAYAKAYKIELDPHPGLCDFIQNKYRGKTGEDIFETLFINHEGEESLYKFYEHLDEFLLKNNMREYYDIFHKKFE